jgi:hypothetical protein
MVASAAARNRETLLDPPPAASHSTNRSSERTLHMIVAWLVFPALLALLSLGCGLLVERVSGARLPGVLLVPLGLAVIVVVSQLATNWSATAKLATPAVLVVAVAGFAIGVERLRGLRVDWGAVAVAGAVFAVFAAPIALSGEATFAGYNLNGEPSIHFIGIDRLMSHGRSLSGLHPSSYEFCLSAFFGNGYPSGAQTALGSARPLVAQDVAWVYQPFLAFLVAMAALSQYRLLAELVRPRLWRAAIVFIAAQPALLFAYSLQGSLKELATVWIVTLLVALVVELSRRTSAVRSVVPLAVASAAGLGVISVAIAPWLGLIMLSALLLVLKTRSRSQLRSTAIQAVAFLALTAALAYPALSVSGTLFNAAEDQLTAQEGVTAARGLGNLVAPLKKAQVAGIWLSGDYRFQPTGSHEKVTNVLLVVAFASALIGLGWALRRRTLGPLLYMAVSAIAGAYVVRRGSPWADGKALMITSPAVLLAAMLGPAALAERRGRRRWRHVVAGGLAGAIALGVLWSNALAYHDVNLAPRDRLTALAEAGDHVGGAGPTMYLEFEEYGKHFLRDGDPEGRSEACQRRFLPMRNGQFPQLGFTSDLDQQTMRYLLYFRTIVLRRSPAISRPPSLYRRTYANRYYEVWQQPVQPTARVLAHMPLGDPIRPSSVPRCRDIRRLGREARAAGARLAYVPRARSTLLVPAETSYPSAWVRDPSQGHVLITIGPGRIQDSVRVRRPGPYELWIGGSFGRGFRVSIDGRPQGSVAYELNGRDQYQSIGGLSLSSGKHVITLVRGGGSLHPGNGGEIRSLGPVVLEPLAARRRTVDFVRARDAASLCGRELDWVEAVRPA